MSESTYWWLFLPCLDLYWNVLLQDEEEISTSPGVSEFVSDAFDTCNLNQEDLRKEMEQLVLDKKKETSVVEGKATITSVSYIEQF